MKFEAFKPIFGEPQAERANSGAIPGSLHRFLFHVSTLDSSHILIRVTDFHSETWEAKRSVLQPDDMRDEIEIGGSWFEFIDYIVASIQSDDVKLILDGHSNSDGSAHAKLVARKSKGMPRISISLTKLTGSAASEAMAKLSLELFTTFRSMENLIVQGKERSLQLEEVLSTKKERNENIHNQLLYSEREKSLKMNFSDRTDVSASIFSNGMQDSPEMEIPGEFEMEVPGEFDVPVERIDNEVKQETIHPKIGMLFDTADAMFDFYKEYAFHQGFAVMKRGMSKGKDGVRRYITFRCRRSGKPRGNTENNLHRINSKTGCSAHINGRLEERDGKWVVTDVVLQHNHEIDPTISRAFRCNRRIPTQYKKTL